MTKMVILRFLGILFNLIRGEKLSTKYSLQAIKTSIKIIKIGYYCIRWHYTLSLSHRLIGDYKPDPTFLI